MTVLHEHMKWLAIELQQRLKRVILFPGLCFNSAGHHGKREGASADLPQGLPDGEHHPAQDEPLLLPHGESLSGGEGDKDLCDKEQEALGVVCCCCGYLWRRWFVVRSG